MNDSLPRLPSPAIQAPDFDEVIDLRRVVDAVISGRFTIIGVVFISILTGLAYYWLTDPVYRADALVQIEKKTQSVTGSPSELYDLFSGRDSTSTEIELIKSRLVIGRVVDQLRLDIEASPSYFPIIGRAWARRFQRTHPGELAASFPGLSQYSWGGESIVVSLLDLPDDLQEIPLRLRVNSAEDYELFGPENTLLVKGRVGSPANLSNDAGGLFIRELRARPGTDFIIEQRRRLEVIRDLTKALKVTERGKLSAVLSITLEHTDPYFATQVVNAVATVYQRQNVERRSAEAEQTLAFVNEQLPRVQKDLQSAENAVNSYRLSQKSADLTKETELVLQQIVGLEQKRVELQQKREEALRRFTDKHPVIQALDGQLKQIASEQDSLSKRVKGLPETQQELLRLSRDVQVNNSLYTSLLSNAEQLRIAKAGTIGNVRIVDLALQPYDPIRPKVAPVLILSALVGMLSGLLAVFISRSLKRGITDPSEIERQFHLPTYATIPYTKSQSRIARQIRSGDSVNGILANLEPNNPAVEAIRSLRTALHVEEKVATNNLLMICGPSPEIGKSFVSINLAATLAVTGRRILLIDADLRRGQLHQYLASDRGLGLSDLILEKCNATDVVRNTPQKNLSFVSTGTIPANPSELLLNKGFDKALHWFSENYDLVIIDTAPILIVTDAVITGRSVGATLLVLKSSQHTAREVEDTIKRLKAGKVEPMAIVFNQTSPGKGGVYGTESGYYNYDYSPVKK